MTPQPPFQRLSQKLSAIFGLGCIAILQGMLIGCASSGATEGSAENSGDPADDQYYVVSTEFTPFYTLGPQQASGPDLSLRQDDLVVLIKRSFGYSQVSIDDGRTGWLATSDIKPAPPELLGPTLDELVELESTAIVSSSGSPSRRSSGRNSGTSSSAIVETISSSPLTEEALPESAPLERPSFRY